MSRRYAFFSRWMLGAPVEQVWRVLSPDERPEGSWLDVESVDVVSRGDRRGEGRVARTRLRSPLGIVFTTDVRVVRRRPPALLELASTGDLEGEGRWTLGDHGKRTLVCFDWVARTTKPWMNVTAALLAPVFRWNHDRAMDRFGADLARRAGATLEILA
jgi:hypothetical protein